MKRIIFFFGLSILSLFSCSDDDFDVSTFNPLEIDTSYVDPFAFDLTDVYINYLDIGRIDTLVSVGMYCADPILERNYFLVTNNLDYRPNSELSNFEEDSNFYALVWENEFLLDSGLVAMDFNAQLLFNTDLITISSLSGQAQMNIKTKNVEDDNIQTIGLGQFEAINTSSSISLGTVELEFAFSDLTRVLCN